jgi:hypothetical protein
MTEYNDDLDAEFQVREVFAYFGRAMYAASCVEHGLTIGLLQAELMQQVAGRARRERKAPGRAEWEAMFDAHMARHDLLPLGTLVDRFRSVATVEHGLDGMLGETLRRRNHLAHGFFRESAGAFAHAAGRAAMIEALKNDHELFSQTDRLVQAAVAPVLPKIGIAPERHRLQIEAITSELMLAAGVDVQAEE